MRALLLLALLVFNVTANPMMEFRQQLVAFLDHPRWSKLRVPGLLGFTIRRFLHCDANFLSRKKNFEETLESVRALLIENGHLPQTVLNALDQVRLETKKSWGNYRRAFKMYVESDKAVRAKLTDPDCKRLLQVLSGYEVKWYLKYLTLKEVILEPFQKHAVKREARTMRIFVPLYGLASIVLLTLSISFLFPRVHQVFSQLSTGVPWIYANTSADSQLAITEAHLISLATLLLLVAIVGTFVWTQSAQHNRWTSSSL